MSVRALPDAHVDSPYPRFSKGEYERRYRLIRGQMQARGLTCLVFYGAYRLHNQANSRYVSNLVDSFHCYTVFPLKEEPTLFSHIYPHTPTAQVMSCIEDTRWGGWDTKFDKPMLGLPREGEWPVQRFRVQPGMTLMIEVNPCTRDLKAGVFLREPAIDHGSRGRRSSEVSLGIRRAMTVTSRSSSIPPIELTAKLVTAAHIMYYAGWRERIDGHVSVRIPSEDAILIPSHYHVDGRSLMDIGVSDVMRVQMDGTWSGPLVPVDEYHLHLEVYRRRPDVQSVAHSRPFHATALSTTDASLLPLTRHAAIFSDGVPVCDNGGRLSVRTPEDGRRVADAMGDGWGVMVRGPGVVTAGRTVEEATIRLGFLEEARRFQYVAQHYGRLRPLSAAELADFAARFDPQAFFIGAWRYYERRLPNSGQSRGACAAPAER